MRALIDGDPLVYICGFASESSYYATDDGMIHATAGQAKDHCHKFDIDHNLTERVVEPEPIENTLHLVKNILTKIDSRVHVTDKRSFLSGDTNFREDIATIRPYKGNRPDRKPFHYKEIREYLINVHKATVVEGFEADDALGIEHIAGKSVICTIDKDLDMVAGLHYNYQKDKLYDVDEITALKNFYMQLLTGDTTDNIRGVPNIGKVKARNIIGKLRTEEEMYWDTLREYCKTHDKPYDALLENARLLYILREYPIKLWEPPV